MSTTSRANIHLAFGFLAFSAFIVAIGGCELIATADRSLIDQGGTMATGGSGGAGSCVAEECPGNDTDCRKRSCAADDTCSTADEAAGTTCSDDNAPEAKVCDGVGSCVECVVMADCLGTELCIDLLCVPATCVNGDLDGDESDVDCGGSCVPCINGDDCNDREDCASNFCDAGLCAACTPGGADCDAAYYCDSSGVCVDKLIGGDVCTDGEQCSSGFCPTQDGVCCDTACDTQCAACLTAKNGGAGNGTCAAVPLNDDPDTECPVSDALCQAGGCNGSAGSPGCNAAPDGVVCRPGSGDLCDPNETCASGVCPSDVFDDGSTVCNAGSGDVCDPDESCPGVAGMACPADQFDDGSTTCAAKAGSCDLADMCPGVADMPCVDTVATMGATGSPDCAEYVCDGTTKDCPDTCDGDEDCDTVGGFTCNLGPNRCQ